MNIYSKSDNNFNDGDNNENTIKLGKTKTAYNRKIFQTDHFL